MIPDTSPCRFWCFAEDLSTKSRYHHHCWQWHTQNSPQFYFGTMQCYKGPMMETFWKTALTVMIMSSLYYSSHSKFESCLKIGVLTSHTEKVALPLHHLLLVIHVTVNGPWIRWSQTQRETKVQGFKQKTVIERYYWIPQVPVNGPSFCKHILKTLVLDQMFWLS